MIENFAEILKQRRESMKPRWTQSKAAEAIGVSLRQYQKYERNLMPPWDVLARIKYVFGISLTNIEDGPKSHNDQVIISQRHLII